MRAVRSCIALEIAGQANFQSSAKTINVARPPMTTSFSGAKYGLSEVEPLPSFGTDFGLQEPGSEQVQLRERS